MALGFASISGLALGFTSGSLVMVARRIIVTAGGTMGRSSRVH